jgi:hypothetical protein
MDLGLPKSDQNPASAHPHIPPSSKKKKKKEQKSTRLEFSNFQSTNTITQYKKYKKKFKKDAQKMRNPKKSRNFHLGSFFFFGFFVFWFFFPMFFVKDLEKEINVEPQHFGPDLVPTVERQLFREGPCILFNRFTCNYCAFSEKKKHRIRWKKKKKKTKKKKSHPRRLFFFFFFLLFFFCFVLNRLSIEKNQRSRCFFFLVIF